MANWWDGATRSSRKKKYNSYSSNQNVEDAAEDLKDEINEDSAILVPLLTAAGLSLEAIAEKLGVSIAKVVEWRWPHE